MQLLANIEKIRAIIALIERSTIQLYIIIALFWRHNFSPPCDYGNESISNYVVINAMPLRDDEQKNEQSVLWIIKYMDCMDKK